MRQFSQTISVRTRKRGLVEITDQVTPWAESTGLELGLLTLFCRHTSASLVIQENAARAVRRDLEDFFDRIAPEDPTLYAHNDEGPDDMPAHIRTALTGVSLSVPLVDGQVQLGTWQGIYLFEHRAIPHDRKVVLLLQGQ